MTDWPQAGGFAQFTGDASSAGSFGAFFRAMLGIVPLRNGVKISPRLPLGITRLKTLAPVFYGGKQVFFDIRQGDGSRADDEE
ncbi:MAG: hypothetical protein V1800_09975 [Candidatus Latescibacterota bacterium]